MIISSPLVPLSYQYHPLKINNIIIVERDFHLPQIKSKILLNWNWKMTREEICCIKILKTRRISGVTWMTQRTGQEAVFVYASKLCLILFRSFFWIVIVPCPSSWLVVCPCVCWSCPMFDVNAIVVVLCLSSTTIAVKVSMKVRFSYIIIIIRIWMRTQQILCLFIFTRP